METVVWDMSRMQVVGIEAQVSFLQLTSISLIHFFVPTTVSRLSNPFEVHFLHRIKWVIHFFGQMSVACAMSLQRIFAPLLPVGSLEARLADQIETLDNIFADIRIISQVNISQSAFPWLPPSNNYAPACTNCNFSSLFAICPSITSFMCTCAPTINFPPLRTWTTVPIPNLESSDDQRFPSLPVPYSAQGQTLRVHVPVVKKWHCERQSSISQSQTHLTCPCVALPMSRCSERSTSKKRQRQNIFNMFWVSDLCFDWVPSQHHIKIFDKNVLTAPNIIRDPNISTFEQTN